MITYILALILANHMDTAAPQAVAPFKDREACMVAAEKANNTDRDLRTPEARKAGAQYACLKIEKVTV